MYNNQNELRGFVAIGFEKLCQRWVAIDWERHQILLGECKWGGQPVDRQVVRELIEEKGPIVRSELPDKGAGWTLHYAVFTRAGFTDAASAEINARGGLAIDLQQLEAGLAMG